MTIAMGLAAAPDRVALPKGGSISAAAAAANSLTLTIHDRPDLAAQIQVSLDDTVASNSQITLEVVAEVSPEIVIIEDTHASRSTGLGFCQAGKEQFLRILHLGEPAKETLRIKLSSCIESLDLDDSGVTWNADERTLAIQWLAQPTARYRVSRDAEVQQL